jgi:septal ring factor EnvC (AmiA/AmiB activator)
MQLINRTKTISPLLASSLMTVLLVALATPAFADTGQQNQTQRQLAAQLSDFKRAAFEMRREADTLSVATPGKRLHWKSHADRLSKLKGQVNQLGQNLADLEAQVSEATDTQAMAIEHARPHLAAVADNVTRAIRLLNGDRNSVHGMEYAEAVNDIYSHADALHSKLDTILDYDASRMRLESLNLQPVLTEGS